MWPGPSDIKVLLDTSTTSTAVVSGVLNLADISVDAVTGMVFWIEGTYPGVKVRRSKVDNGSIAMDVYVHPQAGSLVGVAVFEDFAYVATDGGAILKIDKFGRQGNWRRACNHWLLLFGHTSSSSPCLLSCYIQVPFLWSCTPLPQSTCIRTSTSVIHLMSQLQQVTESLMVSEAFAGIIRKGTPVDM